MRLFSLFFLLSIFRCFSARMHESELDRKTWMPLSLSLCSFIFFRLYKGGRHWDLLSAQERLYHVTQVGYVFILRVPESNLSRLLCTDECRVFIRPLANRDAETLDSSEGLVGANYCKIWRRWVLGGYNRRAACKPSLIALSVRNLFV